MATTETKRIDYQFIPVPTELLFALDPYCLKAILIMMDKESYWKSRSKVFNGYFTLSVEELAEYLCLGNRKDARLTLEALYRAGLIDIKTEAGKRLGAKVKLNWDAIKSDHFESVEKLPRTEQITYCTEAEVSSTSTLTGTTGGTFCTATLEEEQDTEQDLKIDTEPTAEETSTLPGRIETPAENFSSTFGDYLEDFIGEYPNINYSYPPELFNSIYSQQLTRLQSQVREGLGKEFSIQDLSVYLHFYKTTGRVLE